MNFLFFLVLRYCEMSSFGDNVVVGIEYVLEFSFKELNVVEVIFFWLRFSCMMIRVDSVVRNVYRFGGNGCECSFGGLRIFRSCVLLIMGNMVYRCLKYR